MGTPSPSQSLRLPGEEGWECWLLDARGAWQKSAKPEAAAGGIFAIPLQSLDSSPFWVPQASESRLAETTDLRWEALGMEPGAGGQHWVQWPVATIGDKLLVGSVALADDACEELWHRSLPDSFEISARLYPISHDEAAIWRELGRLVMAVQRNGQLLHTTLLSARVLDGAAAKEIRDLLLALDMQGLLAPLQAVNVWTESAPEFTDALQSALGARIHTGARPAPHPPHTRSHLLPAAAAAIRRDREKARRQAMMLTATTLVVLLCFAAWAGWLTWRQHKLDAALAILRVDEPRVAQVQEAQLRWRALEPAIDPATYPVEIFDQIVNLLPEEGIRFLDFSMDLETLVISGEATSPIHASKFQADLKASPALERYAFNTPVPTIRPDNRAIFRVEGNINDGGEHEAQ
jgi:hypothetical protein